ncbi:MAG: acetyl-CoA carboxylase biotin carboxyl carrier protein [Alphaproteobacteria bacterium]
MEKDLTTSEFIRELAKIIEESGLTEIEIERDDIQIRLAKEIQITQVAAAPVQMPAPSSAFTPAAAATNEASAAATPAEVVPSPENHPGVISAPMVGIVYTKPDPDTDDFVSVGTRVNEGDTLLLIEAMKVFNPIKAPRSGTVKQIFVEAGEPVEFGSPLLIIE